MSCNSAENTPTNAWNVSCCALTAVGNVECWLGDGTPNGLSPSGSFVEVAMTYRLDWNACGMSAAGVVACGDPLFQSNVPVATFTSLAAQTTLVEDGGPSAFCGTDDLGQVWLWGATGSALLLDLPPATYADVGRDCACGVTDEGVLNCLGGRTFAGEFSSVDPAGAWALRVDGSIQKLHLDGSSVQSSGTFVH